MPKTRAKKVTKKKTVKKVVKKRAVKKTVAKPTAPKKKTIKQEIAEISIEFLLTHEFNTPKEFSDYLTTTAIRNRETVFETLSAYCEAKGLDPRAAASLLTPDIKAIIEDEVRKLNLLH